MLTSFISLSFFSPCCCKAAVRIGHAHKNILSFLVKLNEIKDKVCDTLNHKYKYVLYSQLSHLNVHISKWKHLSNMLISNFSSEKPDYI